MSSHPLFRHFYDLAGWVISEIKIIPEMAVIKLRRDKSHRVYCPHYTRKDSENRAWGRTTVTF